LIKRRIKTIIVSKWNHSQGTSAMATTITLKNLPDDIYERLKESAKANHRSINSEVIACLEKALFSAQVSPQERLDRARQLRKSLKLGNFHLEEIAKGIDSDRL
jgi:plasmid stability protein